MVFWGPASHGQGAHLIDACRNKLQQTIEEYQKRRMTDQAENIRREGDRLTDEIERLLRAGLL